MKFEDYIIPMCEILTPIFTALLGWISYRLAEYIKTKTKSQKAAAISTQLFETVGTLVAEAEQTLVAEMKRAKGTSSSGGVKLTSDEAAGVRLAVAGKVKKYLGEKGLKEISNSLGVGRDSISPFIESKIEEAVLNLRKK